MATGDSVLSIDAKDFLTLGGAGGMAQADGPGQGGVFSRTVVGNFAGVSFPDGLTTAVIAMKRVPKLASLATGLTFKLLLAADPLNPGSVSQSVKMGVNVGVVGAGGGYYPVTTNSLGTEATGTIVLASTTGQAQIGSIAIVTANIGGTPAAGDWFGIFQIRRIGADAADTFTGRVVLLGVSVLDT